MRTGFLLCINQFFFRRRTRAPPSAARRVRNGSDGLEFPQTARYLFLPASTACKVRRGDGRRERSDLCHGGR